MANVDIKYKAKSEKVPLWQIAATLGVSEATITRWLRIELDENKKRLFLGAIEYVKRQRTSGHDAGPVLHR